MTDKDDMKVLEKMDQDTILEYVWENLMDDIQDMMRDEFGSDVHGWYGIDRKGMYCMLDGSKSYIVNFAEVKSE